MKHKIKPVGGTHTELHLNDGTVVLYSYVTPVAARLSDGSFVRTDRQVSSATARRIRVWLHGAPARSVSHIAEILIGHIEELDRMCEKLSLALRRIRDAAICARWPSNRTQAAAMNASRAVLREWEKMRREDDV